jgi:glycosyltransferase involved in cell wall biosynthesis
MRVVHITAGAGGRICGSCLHDNTLVRALRARGLDAILLPAYVPTTTDEQNVAEPQIVLGGLNVYLQEHLAVFRHTPWFVDRLLDRRWLLEWLSSRTGTTTPADLGRLTASTLAGETGRQAKEIEKLARRLAREPRPDVVHLSNVLLSGLARRIRQTTGAGIVATLSGEDLFVEGIPEPWYTKIRSLLRQRAADIDRFVALNDFFAEFMADYLGLHRSRIEIVPHGIDTAGFPETPPDLAARRSGPLRVGFLARACPEKGLHLLVEAVGLLRANRDVELLAAGASVAAEADYLRRCRERAESLGIAEDVRWLGQVDRQGKLDLLSQIDLFAMPTTHPEAKGLPVLEAMAAGVPVVAPRHGCFPEYLGGQEEGHGGEACGVGHAPGDAASLAAAIGELADDPQRAAACGRSGHALARRRHSWAAMAGGHEEVYRAVARPTRL